MQNDNLKVFFLPALGVADNYYLALVEELKKQLHANVSIISPPGPGDWGQRLTASVKVGYPEMVHEISKAVQDYKSEHPDQRVLLMGHSLGGHFAMLVASRLGPLLHGVVLVASGSPHWGAWPAQEQSRLRRGVGFINFLSILLPWYPGGILGFGGNQSRKLMRDWCQFASNGRLLELRGIGALQSAAAQLTLPVLTVYVEGDTLAPEKATDHLLAGFDKIVRTSVTLGADQLPGVPLPRRHFAWCRQPEPTCRVIESWLVAM
jgi:predicted alpha/beta hydrolase